MRRLVVLLGPVLVSLALGGGTAAAAPAVLVHGMSPYAPGCPGVPQSGTTNVNAEVEPWVGDNDAPAGAADPDNLVGAWQQDRFSNGGSRGLLTGFSTDGGASWAVPALANQPKISLCQGGTGATGDYERATDPWSDISPDGDAWFMSLSFNDTRNLANAMVVAKSSDGGATWPLAQHDVLIRDTDPNVFNDKNSLTADPNDSDFVYAVWDRLVFPNERSNGNGSPLRAAAFKGPTYFSKTENDGATWETRKILDLGRNDQTISNQIAVRPDSAGAGGGELVNVFDWIHNDNRSGRKGEKISVLVSDDRGDTWSAPVVIDPIANAVVVDDDPSAIGQCPAPRGTKSPVCPLRTGDGVPDIAVDPDTGALYVVWQDGGAGGNVQILLSRSADGTTWSAPRIVNGDANTDAHTPSVEVNEDGDVAVSYYDFRKDVDGDAPLTTTHWMRTSTNGGTSFGVDEQLGADFDTRRAPFALGYFLGDYDGLGSVGSAFKPFWISTQAPAGTPANRTDVFAASVP